MIKTEEISLNQETTAQQDNRKDTGEIIVHDLVRQFGERKILEHFNLNIADGEFVALLGRSGSGKSTFLRALAQLDHEVSGSGEILMSADFSMIFQDARLLPWISLINNVILGNHRKGARVEAQKLLAEVGLKGRDKIWPHELSGGEAQRAALARSLLQHPKVILADEPFSALDALTRLQMQTLLQTLIGQYQTTVVFVTHDVDEAIRLADRVILLVDGKIGFEYRLTQVRPRRRDSEEFIKLREELLRRLGITEID